jgi:hypothetical protein
MAASDMPGTSATAGAAQTVLWQGFAGSGLAVLGTDRTMVKPPALASSSPQQADTTDVSAQQPRRVSAAVRRAGSSA